MDEESRYTGSYIDVQERVKIPKKHIILFVLTIITTYFVQGIYYSLAIITILLAHEMGHYFACRAYRVPATLPFFIPLPLPPFGTLGAIIKMKGHIPDRRALFDIGVAGPIMGLVFAVPAIALGLTLSQIIEGPMPSGTIKLGEPYLFKIILRLVVGELSENQDIILHPIAFAGWAGLFVTALNLLPIGQLDGGHIIYAIAGRASRYVYTVGLVILIGITIFVNRGWIILLILLLLFARKHPPTLYDELPLDRKRVIIGIVMIAIFFLSFTATPIIID